VPPNRMTPPNPRMSPTFFLKPIIISWKERHGHAGRPSSSRTEPS
jgi:hypothetical protein